MDELTHDLRQLAAAMTGEGPVPVTAENEGQMIRVLAAALRSASEGRIVSLGTAGT
jgi:scyllo-inositol 2-dehydrogenase (NADP+)